MSNEAYYIKVELADGDNHHEGARVLYESDLNGRDVDEDLIYDALEESGLAGRDLAVDCNVVSEYPDDATAITITAGGRTFYAECNPDLNCGVDIFQEFGKPPQREELTGILECHDSRDVRSGSSDTIDFYVDRATRMVPRELKDIAERAIRGHIVEMIREHDRDMGYEVVVDEGKSNKYSMER